MRRVALSTVDNPFNPITQFDDWDRFDRDYEHYSSARLARIARYSDAMTEEESEKEKERAIDEIVKYDFLNIYTKVVMDIDD